jgi:hypothetical protein
MIAEFAALGVDGTALKPIPAMVIDTVFGEVTNVLSSHSLNGASLEDFLKLFRLVQDFGNDPCMVVIDRKLLKEKGMSLIRFSIQRFHEEYSVRLKNALERRSGAGLRLGRCTSTF